MIHHRFAVCVATVLIGFGLSSFVHADSFDWRDVGGHSYVTTPKSQGMVATCAAFAAVGTLESKYMITRNDYTYAPNLSEQQLLCETGPYDGHLISTEIGGWGYMCLDYFTSTGVVSEGELFYRANNESPNWPLAEGWENRVWKSTSNSNFLPSDNASIKAALKRYGPLEVSLSTADLGLMTLGTEETDHAVILVGYVDDESYYGGGYWIIKNSWGSGWDGDGYGQVVYGNIERHNHVNAIDNAAYYTGSMGTATWGGGSGTWASGASDNWTTAGNITAAWQNRETLAVFNTPASSVALTDTVIANGLEFHAGATGYAFAGGSLTVTGGGIVAQESVTINSPMTIGAPQVWSVAAGKTLSVGDVHTVISTLTIDGAGDTYIAGAVDGGGVINSLGAAAGELVMNGTGTLTLAGDDTRASNTTIQDGTFLLAASGSMLMDINDPADYFTQILGDGDLFLDGTLLLDVEDVTATSGAWELIDDLLATSYGETFSMELIGGGVFAPSGDLLAYTDAMNHLWTFSETTGTLTMTMVPEPSVLILMVIGFVGFIAYIRKR